MMVIFRNKYLIFVKKNNFQTVCRVYVNESSSCFLKNFLRNLLRIFLRDTYSYET